MDDRRVVGRTAFNFWVLVVPADSVPSEWVAHCLDFDIVSQGTSAEEAFDQILDAVSVCLSDDLARGADPLVVRPRAPVECWEQLHAIVAGGEKVSSNELRSAMNEGGEQDDVEGERVSIEFAVWMSMEFAAATDEGRLHFAANDGPRTKVPMAVTHRHAFGDHASGVC